MGERLRSAQSAYLRQHADNPVDWWPWGPEPFEEARRRDVPVFISIGYAACHWCHVMAGESFDDAATAELLNEQFVSVKVDREEHPDVDDTYMAAVQAMTGHGGWPMSIFTLPDGRVFHAGTYYPPRRTGQVPSFTEVLQAVTEAWQQRRDQVEDQAGRVAEALGSQRRQQSQLATVVTTDATAEVGITAASYAELTEQTLATLAEQEDTAGGGFGTAPKFPPSPLLGWLLEESAWNPDSPAGGLAVRTMETMARSALFDHVEGGFARYATDRNWRLPHFEKMLYDNAQLLGHYARLCVHPAANQAQRDQAAAVTTATIDWLQRRMVLDSGLLASSLDADTVYPDGTHVEGGTYLFSDEEMLHAAGDAGLDSAQAEQLLRLNRGVPADEHAVASGAPLNITAATPRTLHFDALFSPEERQLWERVVPQLRRRRAHRPQPARDEKVVAAWNAQAIRSLAEVSMLCSESEALDFALQLAERLWEVHVVSDDLGARVYRTSYDGQRGAGLGTLADHAEVASACFALVSAGADQRWLQRGRAVLSFACHRAVDYGTGHSSAAGSWTLKDSLEDSPVLTTAQAGPAHASPFDGPEPSGIAAFAVALQTAEAYELAETLPPVVPVPRGEEEPVSAEPHKSGQKGNTALREPLRAAAVLKHVPVVAPKAPQAAGASLVAAARIARKSPALRVFTASAEDLAQIRRAAALHGVPVEPFTEETSPHRTGDDLTDQHLTDQHLTDQHRLDQHRPEQHRPEQHRPGPQGNGEEGTALRPLRVSVCLNGVGAMVCLPPVGSADEALESIRPRT